MYVAGEGVTRQVSAGSSSIFEPTDEPTLELVPTVSPDQATRLASDENAPRVAIAAGLPQPTRVFGGVPVLEPNRQPTTNTWLIIGLAVVLIIGAVLLGLAGFFVWRR